MIDEVFFPEEKDVFISLLPKLYKKQYKPCENNFIVKENDKVKATVGLFYSNISVCGKNIKCGGIGNVAVTQDSRSKGYMIDCMNMAIEDMKRNKADLSLLGGQRQRYGYFSFEPSGVCCNFSVNKKNIKHCFGENSKCGLNIKELDPENRNELEQIDKLFRAEHYYVEHDIDMLYDIMCSWRAKTYVMEKNAVVKGFFSVSKGNDSIKNYRAVDKQSLKELVLAVFETVDASSLTFNTPMFYKQAVEFFTNVAEHSTLSHSACYTVLNFENVCSAFLELELKNKKLCDGKIVLLIHGFNGDENLEFKVQEGKATVRKTDKTHDLEFSHNEAMRLLFSLFSNERNNLPPEVQQWLPFSLYFYHCDSV